MTPSARAAACVAGLHVLADDDPRWKYDPVEQARAACAGGAAVVQLRSKRGTDREILAFAAEIRALTRAHGVRFVMNDRFDLALASDADGVHLGQEDVPPERIPPSLRARLLVGRSTHDPAQAMAARDAAVDYVAYGPVFGTRSKETGYDARGPETLGAVARSVAPIPVVAIGGIDAGNAGRVRAAGAVGFAVISAVAAAADPLHATRDLVAAWADAAPAARA